MKCTFKKPDGTKCTANAMHNSKYCCFHNPEIPDNEKKLIRSKGGSNSHPSLSGVYPAGSGREGGWEGEVPPMKMENMRDIVSVLADTINNVRTGKISQKSGSTIAYLSYIIHMAMDKAKAEEKQEKMDKLKSEGKWRPEPKYSPKFYSYKDEFFLDKDGNHLVVEKDGSTFYPLLDYKPEYQDNINNKQKTVERDAISLKSKRHKKCKIKRFTKSKMEKSPDKKSNKSKPVERFAKSLNIQKICEKHKEGSNNNNDYNRDSDEPANNFENETVEILHALKEGMEMRKHEEENTT